MTTVDRVSKYSLKPRGVIRYLLIGRMICQSFRQTYSIKAFSVLQLISKMQWHFRRIIWKTLTREQQITRQDVPVLPRVSDFSKILSSVIDFCCHETLKVHELRCHLSRASLTSRENRWKIQNYRIEATTSHMSWRTRVHRKKNVIIIFSEICLYVFTITKNYSNRLWWYRSDACATIFQSSLSSLSSLIFILTYV